MWDFKVGDCVWLGSSMAKVVKLTPKQIGLDNGRRYSRDGKPIGHLSPRISRIATPDEIAEWDTKQQIEEQEKLQAIAREALRVSLQSLLNPPALSTNPPLVSVYEGADGNWDVSFRDLSEARVRLLARIIAGYPVVG